MSGALPLPAPLRVWSVALYVRWTSDPDARLSWQTRYVVGASEGWAVDEVRRHLEAEDGAYLVPHSDLSVRVVSECAPDGRVDGEVWEPDEEEFQSEPRPRGWRAVRVIELDDADHASGCLCAECEDAASDDPPTRDSYDDLDEVTT